MRLTDDGRVASLADTRVVAQALTLDDIAGLLSTLQSGVNSISTRINTILSRIPDRPDVRALVAQVDVDHVTALLAAVQDDASGVLAVLDEERSGFQTFVGGANGSCGAGTPCAAFKQDLAAVFVDLEEAWVTAQRLECLEKPDLVVHPLDTTYFQTLLVDRAPLVALFFMQKLLDQFVGWQTIVADGLAAIPGGLTQLCDDLPPPAACAVSVERKCCVLRPKTVGNALARTKVSLALAPTVFKLVRRWTTDDKDAMAAAVVGGGAGAGTNVKNPAHGGASTLETVAEKLGKAIENAVSVRDKCVDADLTREQDLFDCKGLVAYLLPYASGGQYEQTLEAVERRIADMEAAGLDAKLLGKARTELARARDGVGTSKGYKRLCAAYRALVR